MILDRDGIFEEMKLETETVALKKGEVVVSEISADDYIKLYTDPICQTDDTLDMSKFTAALIVRCVVDEQGDRIFTDDDISKLKKGSPRVYGKIAAAARRLNGLEKPIEEEAKN